MTTKFGFGLELNVDNILKRVNQLEAFKYYCPDFEQLGKKFSSEFRNDSVPSCVIYEYSGNLYYKDFGDPNPPVGIIGYVQRKYRISFGNSLEKINRDMNLGLGESGNFFIEFEDFKLETPKLAQRKKTPTIIEVEARKFESKDESYWKLYGISKDTLVKYHVFPISWFSINGIWQKADSLAYCYHYYKVNGTHLVKIYQPHKRHGERGRWYTNTDRSVVQGEGVLAKKGKNLIITKALKDVMVLRELGYESIAPNSESVLLPAEYVNKQQKRFENIFLLFDSDLGGLTGSAAYLEKWPFMKMIFIMPFLGSKDISDVVKDHGISTAKDVLLSLIYGQESDKASEEFPYSGREDKG